MRCPRCAKDGFQPHAPCAECGFTGPPDQVEELGHVAYLLGEVETWGTLGPIARDWVRNRYLRRRQELETGLGLRKPALTPEEARDMQWELFCLGQLEEEVAHWVIQGWVRAEPAERMIQGSRTRAKVLNQRLAQAKFPPAPAFESVPDRLKLLNYLKGMAKGAYSRGHFVSDATYAAAQAGFRARREELEIEAGLRPRPVEVAPVSVVEVPVAPPWPAKPARPPRQPITWDRVWQTLLSERTLNILLFLGAFLLVASATTYIVYNWETLPPAIQLGFIVLFTLSFYLAGWFLRTRMKLHLSGIAVTAVGSLLVPLDFYAVGIAGGAVPAEAWPWVWLVASAVCLPIYIFTALRIQAQFFGYLVAVATGSLVCAVLQVLGVPQEWFLTALVAVALGLAALAYHLKPPALPARSEQSPSPLEGGGQDEGESSSAEPVPASSPWSVLSQPFRFSALIATAVLLLLGIGWWVAAGVKGWQFDASLALSWAFGAVLFAYAAVQERSPLLGRAAAAALPGAVLLILRLPFDALGIEAPWYGLGLAALAPLYLWTGRRWYLRSTALPATEPIPAPEQPAEAERAPKGEPVGDAVLRAHSQTATGWGIGLLALAAVGSAFDLWAAAVTQIVLAADIALAVRLWDRPRALPVSSLLAFSSVTFAMAAGHLAPAELCLGWALLAVLHVLVALRLRSAPRFAARNAARYAAWLFAGALVIAALALLPPLILADELLLTYVLGHWIALAAWLAWLDHTGEHAGLTALLSRFGPLRQSVLHWAMALPLPFFAAMLYTRFRAPDAWLGLLLAALAWISFAIGQMRRLTSTSTSFRPPSAILRHWSLPWYTAAYGCSLAGPTLALTFYDQPLLAVTVLLASALYFASAWAFRSGWWFVPAGLTLPLGLWILLDFWAVPWPQQSLVLAAIVAVYLLGGVALERLRAVPHPFLRPLYAVAHLVSAFALVFGLAPAVDLLVAGSPWTDAARMWAVGGQLLLGVTYGLLAWFQARERWAHVAVWLGVLAGGLVASAYSQGHGSSAFKVALLAAVYVLAERALTSRLLRRRWPAAERAWSLYRRPLLIAGWAVSAAAIGLALVRNLVLLGGDRVQTIWAIAGLLAVTALYAASAWMFRRRLFVWLAGVLVLAPWTLLTLWGWFLWPAPPPLPHYALSWAVLACLQLALGLLLTLRPRQPTEPISNTQSPISNIQHPDFGFPLRVIANILLPFSLFWAVADVGVSSITWGIGLAFYVVSAMADHWRRLTGWRVARFLYPAVAVLPVWAIYLLNRFVPAAPYEVYGLLLLALALPLLVVGRGLRRFDAADGLPLYLGAYGVAVVGTLLVAHERPLLAAALTFDALLCVLSAWIFREPLWGYPAVALAPAAMLVALAESQLVPPERRGWWLIGLGAAYLVLAWLLRRSRLRRADLRAYGIPPLVAAFAVVALGLPPSSLDDVGAFYGYLAAAGIYAAAAAWLRQPLLLVPVAALLAVPYGVAVVWLGVSPTHYGLALFPGVVVTLALAHLLDWRLGRSVSIFPSLAPKSWRLGALLDWWAGPFYAWGYIGALVAVGLSWADSAWAESARLSIVLALAALTFFHGAWRFRSRLHLLVAGALFQGAALAVIDALGWLVHPAWTALAFLPVTVVTAGLALAVELWRREGSPLSAAWFNGWSRPLYLLLAADLVGGQVAALFHSEPGAIVTAVHALLLALLATVWVQPLLPFVAVGLGVVGTLQGLAWAGAELTGYPVGLALLALGYGLAGYGLGFVLRGQPRGQIWARPLEWSALGLSVVALLVAAGVGVDVVSLLVRTVLGHPVTFADYAAQLQMLMWVLALAGLLYLATAAVRRWYVLGYGAVALLLAAWALWWRFFMNMAGVQWYAVPAGAYLLGVGWLEWRQGRRTLARWIDRVGMLVWLGTAWWQSLPGVMDPGWPYALLMGAEALLLVWWGSARRSRRFLYVGAVAVVLDVLTQSVEPLLSANRWIVFGIAGALVMVVAVLVERNLKKIRELSVEMRARLEGWE